MTDRKAVMTRAWEIRKSEKTNMSISLKKAWAEAKGETELTAEKLASLINDNFGFFWTAAVWEKYGKTRVYVSNKKGRRDAGFIDMTNGIEFCMNAKRDNYRIEELVA